MFSFRVWSENKDLERRLYDRDPNDSRLRVSPTSGIQDTFASVVQSIDREIDQIRNKIKPLQQQIYALENKKNKIMQKTRHFGNSPEERTIDGLTRTQRVGRSETELNHLFGGNRRMFNLYRQLQNTDPTIDFPAPKNLTVPEIEEVLNFLNEPYGDEGPIYSYDPEDHTILIGDPWDN